MRLAGRRYDQQQPIWIEILDGVITAVGTWQASDKATLPWIAPGLVDLQVNGHGGWNFTDPHLSVETVERISLAMDPDGVTTTDRSLVNLGASGNDGVKDPDDVAFHIQGEGHQDNVVPDLAQAGGNGGFAGAAPADDAIEAVAEFKPRAVEKAACNRQAQYSVVRLASPRNSRCMSGSRMRWKAQHL